MLCLQGSRMKRVSQRKVDPCLQIALTYRHRTATYAVSAEEYQTKAENQEKLDIYIEFYARIWYVSCGDVTDFGAIVLCSLLTH